MTREQITEYLKGNDERFFAFLEDFQTYKRSGIQ